MARQQMALQLGRPNWSDENLSGLPEQNNRLWGMVEQYTGHPLLIDFLAKLIDARDVQARDPVALARAIQDYSAYHIKFFRERPERFQSPMRTIAWGIGDCDDKSIFIGASIRSFRIPCRLTILRLLVDGERVGHVYPEAWLGESWVPLESVRPVPWGHNPAVIAAKRDYLVKREFVGDSPEPGRYA